MASMTRDDQVGTKFGSEINLSLKFGGEVDGLVLAGLRSRHQPRPFGKHVACSIRLSGYVWPDVRQRSKNRLFTFTKWD